MQCNTNTKREHSNQKLIATTHLCTSSELLAFKRRIASLSERLWRVFAAGDAAARDAERPGLLTPMLAKGDCAAVMLERRRRAFAWEFGSWVSILIFGGGGAKGWQDDDGVLGVALSVMGVIAELGPAASSSRGKDVWILERPSEKSVE